MPDPLFDELNATTLKEIYPRVIKDQFFKSAALLAYLRQNVKPFGGGASMNFSFLFSPLIGGAYAPGDNFNTTKIPTLSGATFQPKYYYVAVPEFKELLQVQNRGPLAIFSIIDVDLRNAMNTMNVMLAIANWREGTSAPRAKQVNGLSEGVNNGVDPSWDGTIALSYGGQLRNGVVGAALNSTPLWCGNALGAAGPVLYSHLQESFQDCSIGPNEPNLGVCNKALFAYILERIQPQQRFAMEKDPLYGATGFKFMSARILKDEYCPSAVYGENHPILGNYLTTTVVAPGAPTAKSKLPAGQTCTVGEVFGWFNTQNDNMLYRLSDDPEFGVGFSGFIPTQDNTRVVGHVKAAVNLEVTAPRLQKILYGLNS